MTFFELHEQYERFVAQYERHEDAGACSILEKMLEHRLRERVRQFPVLAREPVPPEEIKSPVGGKTYYEQWAELVEQWREGEYRLPQARDLDGLVGPIDTFGTCLNPLLHSRQLLWFDPCRVARQGDFVWIHWHAPALQNFIEANSQDENWRAKYRRPCQSGAGVIKWLNADGLGYWCVTNEGYGFPLGRNQILGVLTHVEVR